MDTPQPPQPPPSDRPSASGRPLPPPAPPAVPAKPPPSLNNFFAKLQSDGSGVLSLLVVLVVGMVLAYILWVPFAEPAKLINDALPDKNCINEIPATSGMRTCAAEVAAVKMIGPLCLGVIVFVLRKRLARLVAKVSAKLHPGARPLMAPLLGTLLFLLVWAGTHANTGGQNGILPQKAFPAIVGVYTFAVVRYGPALQRKMVRFLDRRDKVPFFVRVLVTVAVPTAISLLITNQERVSDTAQKEQLVLLLGLMLAYLLLWPKGGDIASVLPKKLSAPSTAPGTTGTSR